MQKLLIAESSTDLATSLEEAMHDQWEVHLCADGYSAVDTMQYLQPEAMIIDLQLKEKDGLTVLEECFPKVPPVTMALSTYVSPYIEQRAESLGVGYIMRLPCNSRAVGERIADMYESYQLPPTIISQHLRTLNFNISLTGYRCILAAIPFLQADPTLMMKEIYPEVAKICGLTDARNVEHAIRVAIRDAWEKRDLFVWSYYFPLNNDGDIDCPNNKKFLLRIAGMI